ncbi:Crp/Fnr family transcriptional regulator [Entomospira culicis]|uniref:Cyclic nucleotide-binding domain-containing protein n=1 Tax=Entomospira culicis TaxID=2719989 RepID=A0A968KW43_9SPIO|nr:cyclic nucleotide-binding domain-containing protein [Entomospira culicis]NIZ18567.1 cyclic nucleotide-binding domain-containing protein [Entomospira culicis]NIZ68782.1 cyclic nucleotide-binding domain-containing protein [Entomospira culicis]WDI37378.1 cyclic nucleotide-binding domain-containing protein [Entomospira culicis]WDI39007.1 cyclic nucleotide-binding domain-containing protein [Entomospira culicis]
MSETTKTGGLERFLVTFKQGEIIFFEHDTEDVAYMIKQGKIRLVKIINGVEKFVATVGDGDFFGEMAILANNPRSATAIAIEETQAYKISKTNFELLINANVTIATKILTLSAQRIQRQRRQLQILLLNDDETQVLDALLMLYEQLEITNKENVTINITPYELTTWAGVAMDKAKKILATYQENRRISVFPDRIIIQNIQELQRIVQARRKSVSDTDDSTT